VRFEQSPDGLGRRAAALERSRRPAVGPAHESQQQVLDAEVLVAAPDGLAQRLLQARTRERRHARGGGGRGRVAGGHRNGAILGGHRRLEAAASGHEIHADKLAGEELPERAAMSLINANVAAPVNAALALNVASDDSIAYANAEQTSTIIQDN
jgi:hypothetical protein